MILGKITASLLVPVIALSVFAHQLYRQAAYDLSAWKGGGMGMFASADAPHYRFARAIARTGGQTVHLDCFAPDLDDLLTSATHEPSKQNLSELARAVLAKSWYLHDSAVPPAPLPAASMRLQRPPAIRYCPYTRPGGLGDQPVRFESVRVAVYKLNYDRASNTLSAKEAAAHDHIRLRSQ